VILDGNKKRGCKYSISLQPLDPIMEAASGFEPENNGFAVITKGADDCLPSLLLTVYSDNFDQKGTMSFCGSLSCFVLFTIQLLYRGGEDQNRFLSSFKESLPAQHTRG
jgi:hypothetical protein